MSGLRLQRDAERVCELMMSLSSRDYYQAIAKRQEHWVRLCSWYRHLRCVQNQERLHLQRIPIYYPIYYTSHRPGKALTQDLDLWLISGQSTGGDCRLHRIHSWITYTLHSLVLIGHGEE